MVPPPPVVRWDWRDKNGGRVHAWVLDASGAAVFSFESAGAPLCSGGWLGPVLEGYTPDLFADDPGDWPDPETIPVPLVFTWPGKYPLDGIDFQEVA